MTFPASVPEIPVANIEKAAAYYVDAWASPSTGGTTKAASRGSQGEIADCSKIVSEPEDKPWKLREFVVADLDNNFIRVFYDFR